MNPTERFKELLTELAGVLGVDALPLSDSDTCTLVIDNNLPVNLAIDAQGLDLTLFAPLGIIPEQRRAELFSQLLRANGAGTSPYTLGLARQADVAILSTRQPLALANAPGLAESLAAFIDIALRWRATLEAPATDTAAPAAPGNWLQA